MGNWWPTIVTVDLDAIHGWTRSRIRSDQGTSSGSLEVLVHIYIKWKSNPIYPISDGVRWSQTGLALDGSRYARNPVLEGLDRRSPVRLKLLIHTAVPRISVSRLNIVTFLGRSKEASHGYDVWSSPSPIAKIINFRRLINQVCTPYPTLTSYIRVPRLLVQLQHLWVGDVLGDHQVTYHDHDHNPWIILQLSDYD